MAFKKLPPMGDDAMKQGFLSRSFGQPVIDRVNRDMIVITPSFLKKAKVIQSDLNVCIDLSQTLSDVAQNNYHRLSLLNATSGGIAYVRVMLGKVAGRKADSGMTDPSDNPPFKRALTGAGVRVIYCDVTMSYDTATAIWTSTACAISEGASLPANTSTHIYVELGTAERISDGAGGYAAVNIRQTVSGDQWVGRIGNATSYVDGNKLI